MAHLFLFQLGPVQQFIAAGRRTQDLYIGSRILSELAKAGLGAAIDSQGFEPVFPMFVTDRQLPKGVPHRFAFISDETPDELAATVKRAVTGHWRNQFALKVYGQITNLVGKGDWQHTFDRQMTGWIEFYWVAVDYDRTDHGGSLNRANVALAQRKLLRHFPQIDEPGRKCTLTGSQSAVNLDWPRLKQQLGDKKDILIRPNEYLGTTALIKRLAAISGCDFGDTRDRIRSTRFIAGLTDDEEEERDPIGRRQEGYIAVLHIDGDRMGKRLSEFTLLEEHQDFSAKLARFADELVPQIVAEHGGPTGQLIYAGGDDVLALLPLSHALNCADELRKAFFDLTGNTSSAGIAIAPYDFPLDAALDIARHAEKVAKEEHGRDAIVVTEAHGSGMLRHAGGKWPIVELVDRFRNHFVNEDLSGKFGYDLLTVADHMSGRVPSEARKAEVTRLLRRRSSDRLDEKSKKAIESHVDEMMSFGDVYDDNTGMITLRWDSIAHWIILARFLAQPTHEEAV